MHTAGSKVLERFRVSHGGLLQVTFLTEKYGECTVQSSLWRCLDRILYRVVVCRGVFLKHFNPLILSVFILLFEVSSSNIQ